jgi:predicted GIY-YIG superfamily endonuclease
MEFHYVYILQSERDRDHYYVGQTQNLKTRLIARNRGACTATAPFLPWHLKTALAFTNPEKAHAFEHYLKSGSGRAFAKKHL